jgi:hypothetical protein
MTWTIIVQICTAVGISNAETAEACRTYSTWSDWRISRCFIEAARSIRLRPCLTVTLLCTLPFKQNDLFVFCPVIHRLAFIRSSTDRLRTRKHLSSIYVWKWNAYNNPDKIQTGSTHTIAIAVFQRDRSWFVVGLYSDSTETSPMDLLSPHRLFAVGPPPPLPAFFPRAFVSRLALCSYECW